MKPLHLYIITAVGIVAVVTLGIFLINYASYKPSCIEGRLPNGTCAGPIVIDLGITDSDISHSTTENPLGIKAQVIVEKDTLISCIRKCDIPPTPHLVLRSEKGAQFVGYQVCDGLSCKKGNLENSLYVHLVQVLENYSGTTGFEAGHINLGDLPWQVGDMAHIVIKAFPVTLQQNGTVVQEQDKIMTVDLGMSPIAGNNVNASAAESLIIGTKNMTKENQSTVTSDATYLSQTVDEWKNKTPEQLKVYYEKYKDAFYDQLGSFLIKSEMKKELERQNIQNVHDDFQVFPGMTLDSLPPDISYDAVVNATDGNSYLLLGGVSANKIGSIKITKLVFDKDVLNSLNTEKKPSYTNPFPKALRVVISDQEGIKSPVEPYDLTLDLDMNNLVTFYNNSTVSIRIQPHGSGLAVDEGLLSWKSKMMEPNESVVIQFNKTGFYEWDARSPPKGSENWWDYKGGGQIVAFSQRYDNSTSMEKLKMAQVFVTNSDIPWSSTGLDGYGDLEIGLYESVYHMIPDAQKYYAARVMQLTPFDVPVVIASPSIVEK